MTCAPRASTGTKSTGSLHGLGRRPAGGDGACQHRGRTMPSRSRAAFAVAVPCGGGRKPEAGSPHRRLGLWGLRGKRGASVHVPALEGLDAALRAGDGVTVVVQLE